MSFLRSEGALVERVIPGPALYTHAVFPPTAPRGVLGILHGYADHGARYLHVMERLASHDWGSIALDMRGHGRAAGPRGCCARFDEFLDDAAELARLVEERAEGAPTFLMGHSFGGLVATMSVLEARRSWRGLLLSSPYFDLSLVVPRAKILAAKVASRLVPRLGLPSGLHGSEMTHDPSRAASYDSDPLVFREARARWFTESRRAQGIVLARAPEITLPLYVLFGAADPVAKPDAGRRFFLNARSEPKTWDERPGLFHEVLNEPGWEGVVDGMARWMGDRI